MAIARTPRDDWIAEATNALAADGPSGVRVEALARALKVTKGSFYWHFADRQELMDAVLDGWERRGVEQVIDEVDSVGGDARARLRRLFAVASARTELNRTEPVIRDWATRDPGVAKRLGRVDSRRADYLRQLFRDLCDDELEVEARCLLAMSLFVANPLISVGHGSATRRQVIASATEQLLR